MAIPQAPKLRLAPLWPAFAALVLVAAITLLLLPGTLADESARDLAQTLRLIRPELPVPRPVTAAPDADLQRQLSRLAVNTEFRVTLIALDGRVLADNERTLEQVAGMENHGHRPEVLAALAEGTGRAVRSSATLGVELAYAAEIQSGPDGTSWVVRLARPVRALAHWRVHIEEVLVLSALLAAGIALLVSLWLSRTLFRPLENLITAASRIAEGEYDTEIEISEEGELATLGRALRRIARGAKGQIAAVGAERDHLAATVSSMSEGVLVTDRSGVGRLVNPAFRSLFGLGADARAGEVLDLVREPRLGDLIQRVLLGGTADSEVLERVEPEPRSLALLAAPLTGDRGAVIVARDITEAEHLHRMRKDFVANVSHELKTPLAAIRGYAETLVDGAAEEPVTALRFSRRILDQCRRLGELLDDLLTLSRLEGREPLQVRETVDLRRIAQEALELVTVRAAARSVEVSLETGPPVLLQGDPEGLLRLLSNLLDNAIKYNVEGGRVQVRVGVRDATAVVEVSDTGIGIPTAHLSRIFERFYRVDKGRAREEGGTGLGLAIVKHVAQAHQGRVEVESALGRGATFRVLLPRDPD